MLPEDDVQLVERFLSAYNALDAWLQAEWARQRGEEARQSFRSLVDWWAKSHPWWGDAEALRSHAALRNILVHETLAPREYPCVPSPATVEHIEAVREALLHPERAVPRFEKNVQVLGWGDLLHRALRVMHERGFGQLPVYEGARFRGVLSEGIVARWIAAQASSRQEIDVASVQVREVLEWALRNLSRRRAFLWADSGRSVQEIAFLFHENTYLEAVLVSRNGRDDEKLLGLVTRADIVALAASGA
jgi:predicted transcriptional regulator